MKNADSTSDVANREKKRNSQTLTYEVIIFNCNLY